MYIYVHFKVATSFTVLKGQNSKSLVIFILRELLSLCINKVKHYESFYFLYNFQKFYSFSNISVYKFSLYIHEGRISIYSTS